MDGQVDEQSPLIQVAATSVRKSAHTYTYDFFKIGCIKSKSAIVVLSWTLSALVGYNLVNPINAWIVLCQKKLSIVRVVAISATVFLTLGVTLILLMAGLLADIKFGRYKTLRCSSYITLTASTFFVIFLVVYITVIGTVMPHHILKVTFMFILLGILGVLMTSSITLMSSAINFGMDQLHDSSTRDSILFVHWYVWLNYLSVLITGIPWSLYYYDSYHFYYLDAFRIAGFSLYLLIFCVFSFLLVLSMCLVRHRRRWFLIEPCRVNPYKLVYRVVKFAWHHKVPVRRSAFTYCEDEWPSRLDLGKQKYGGPFTVEQVEDVKTFLGILKVLVSIIPLFMLQYVSESMLAEFSIHRDLFFKPPGSNSSYSVGHMIHTEGIVHYLFLSSGLLSPLLVLLIIPLYLFLLRPFITYHLPGLLRTILKRIGVGLLLVILSLLCALAMDVVVHERNSNQLCMFSLLNHTTHIVNESTSFRPRLYQNVYFFTSQHVLSALYNMLIDIGVLEFIASQSPYSMKGLLISVLFSLRILAQALGIIISIPFSISWKTSYPLSCGSGFYITHISIGVITFIVYAWVAKKYKHRTRDEPSLIRKYAEEYYSNIQDNDY